MLSKASRMMSRIGTTSKRIRSIPTLKSSSLIKPSSSISPHSKNLSSSAKMAKAIFMQNPELKTNNQHFNNGLNQKYFIFYKQKLLITNTQEVVSNDHHFLKELSFARRFPFVHNGITHTVAELTSNINIAKDLQWKDLIELFLHLPPEIMEPAGKARQLLEWDKSHQHCGECGCQTEAAATEFCRTCVNEQCKRVFYPKISPVIIVAVERGEEILMARSPHFPPDVFGLIAGFVEPGETLEQAVQREVFEETQIKISNLRYFASQPWPKPNELVMAFQADYKSGDVVGDPKEIEKAGFYHVSALPKSFPGNNSILNQLLNDFRKRHATKKLEEPKNLTDASRMTLRC